MKQIYILTLIMFLNISNLNAQNFINGSFENTTSTGCDYNIVNITFNSKMSNVYAYGTDEQVDIQRLNCFISNIPDGDVVLGISKADAIAIELSSALTSGNTYYITFKAYGITSFSSDLNALTVGSSLTNDSSGTPIYTANVVADTWSDFLFDFVAPNDGNYITISGSNNGNGWTDIDMFIISTTTLSVNEFSKNAIKIHPNPSSDFIEINGLTTIENYEIYNTMGQKVKRGIVLGNEKIDIQSLTNGLYFLKFNNGKPIKFIKI